jgi:hypothetical protein
MDIYDIIAKISQLSLEFSEKRMKEPNYAYAFGMFVAEMQADLDEMNLTKKQYKVLLDRIARLEQRLVNVEPI